MPRKVCCLLNLDHIWWLLQTLNWVNGNVVQDPLYYNHTHSLRYREKSNATELLKAFWNAKDFVHEPMIKWSIADRVTAYQPGSRSCNLRLTEKLAILLADKRSLQRLTKDQSLRRNADTTTNTSWKTFYHSFYFYFLTDVLISAVFQHCNLQSLVVF